MLYLVPVYLASRVIFFLYNRQQLFAEYNLSDIIGPLLYGLRFDLATVFFLNAPYILFCLFAPGLEKTKRVFFVVLNSIGVLLILIDLEYFQFSGKKLTADTLALQADIQDQGGDMLLYYWYFFIALFLAITYIWRLYPKVRSARKYFSFSNLGLSFLFLVLAFICIRGGLQGRSIGAKEAFRFKAHILGNLALNPVYTVLRSGTKKRTDPVKHFNTDREALAIINQKISQKRGEAPNLNSSNVVLIILESFSFEYLEQGYAPFLSEFNQSALFYEGYANGRKSIEVLPSIFIGLPSVLEMPISQSPFQDNPFYSFARYLKNYDFSFYHGAKNGTMGFDSFLSAIGIKNYYGKSEYPVPEHDDGSWGIYDHHYLDYFVAELDKKARPFFSTVFTLSSHHPYRIPKEFTELFPPGDLKIHQSVGYVDFALKRFFEKAKSKSWYENTLFIITADHTSKLQTSRYNNQLGRYRVPIILFHPKINLKPFRKERVVSHIDLLPSVLELLRVDHKPRLPLGNSFFSNEKGFFFTRADDYILYPESDKLGPALEQFFVNGLIKNNLYQHPE